MRKLLPSHAIALSLGILLTLAAGGAHAATAGVAPSAASPAQREDAQTHFARGHDLYAAKKFDDAASEFEKSYAIVGSPNALFFLARCDRERGKLVAAYAELGRTAAEAKEHASEDPRYAKTAEAAGEERDALASQLGFVTVTVIGGTSDTSVMLGGEHFSRAALADAIPVTPGSTSVVVETPGRPAVRQALSVFAGEKKAVTMEAGAADASTTPAGSAAPEPAPPPHVATPEEEAAARDRLRLLSYVSAGVAGAGLITFAVAGIASSNTYSDLQSQCHGPCPPGSGHDAESSRASTQQSVADIGLVVGIVSAGAAVTLFVMSLPPKSDRVSSALVVGPTWMGVRGEF